MPRSYPPEFRRKVLDLLKAGRSVGDLVRDLQISDQTIYTWRRQEQIDTGQVPGMSSKDRDELVAARRRIAEPETELAVHRRAAELLDGNVRVKCLVVAQLKERQALKQAVKHCREDRIIRHPHATAFRR
jgi:transposase-like protein